MCNTDLKIYFRVPLKQIYDTATTSFNQNTEKLPNIPNPKK